MLSGLMSLSDELQERVLSDGLVRTPAQLAVALTQNPSATLPVYSSAASTVRYARLCAFS